MKFSVSLRQKPIVKGTCINFNKTFYLIPMIKITTINKFNDVLN